MPAFRATVPVQSHKLPPSSRAWLARQFRDPYVKARLSYPANYRSRSAFKLLELDAAWKILTHRDVRTVVDLGAAPGGWSQVVAGKLGWLGDTDDTAPMTRQGGPRRKHPGGPPEAPDDDGPPPDFTLLDEPLPAGRGAIVAVDLLPIEPIAGVKTLRMDFLSPSADAYVGALLAQEGDGRADVVLSDMAANFTGNATADQHAGLEICRSVFEFARRHLRSAESVGRRRGGVLVLKHFAHPGAQAFRRKYLVPNFHVVAFSKPPSSRSESSEGYWVCLGWKGTPPPKPPPVTLQDTP